MTLRFVVEGTRSSQRLGTLHKLDTNGNIIEKISTPAPLLFTSRGMVPFITPDFVEQLNIGSAIMNYSWDHIMKESISLPQDYGYPGKLPFTSFHAPSNPLTPKQAIGDNSIGVPTEQGIKRFSPQEFSSVISKSMLPWVCAPADSPLLEENPGKKRITKSISRSLKFLDAVLELKKPHQQVAAILVGGAVKEAREYYAQLASKRDVFGFVYEDIFSVETAQEVKTIFEAINKNIPEQQPRLMLNANGLLNALECIENGVDIVDSWYPFHLAENGFALHRNGSKEVMQNTASAADVTSIDKECGCYCCKNHTRAYLHHLLVAHELLAPILLAVHNIETYFKIFEDIRESIAQDRFMEFKAEMIKNIQK